MTKQEELREQIKAKRKEAETAGAIHKRDLMRCIKRLEKELRTYCYYQRKAKETDKERQRIPA